MLSVRQLSIDNVDSVVARIASRLQDEARLNTLVNPTFSTALLSDNLRAAVPFTWVAIRDGRVVGHLFGAVLNDADSNRAVWVGPDGVSFDDFDILAELYAHAGQSWIEDGALEHLVWVLDNPDATRPWHELGFARVHIRGLRRLPVGVAHVLPPRYRLRLAGPDDLEVALAMDQLIDAAQSAGPSFLLEPGASSINELAEDLDDPELAYYLLEDDSAPIGQCLVYPLPAQRGSFAKTIHLSSVVVREDHRGRGLGRALVDHALERAYAEGFEYADASWRATNTTGARFWTRYGFRTTYVRLHRSVGPY